MRSCADKYDWDDLLHTREMEFMKINLKKFVTVTFMLGVITLLGACSSSNESDSISPEELYLSTQNVEFLSAYPEHTFKQAAFGVQTLELIGEDKYELTSTVTYYSGALEFNDNGTHDEVPRGTDVMVYYGSYAANEEDGLLTIDLEKPETIVSNISLSAGSAEVGYVNTNKWTDDMGAAVGGDSGSISAADYLEKEAFDAMTVIVETDTASFDYIQLKTQLE